MRHWRLAATSILLLGAVLSAQTIPPARISVLTAEERGAPDARDLAAIRAGLRNADEETVRVAVRALGRLQRPALAAEILQQLKSRVPEVRSEAATAAAMALGAGTVTTAARSSVLNALVARLDVEAEAEVRGAVCDAIGHIAGFDTAQFQLAERALVKLAQSDFIDDRLGVARGLEALLRLNASIRSAAPATIDALKRLAIATAPPAGTLPGENALVITATVEPTHDARVRRLAIDALIAAKSLDTSSMATGFSDVDAQVRWRVVRYAADLAATNAGQTRALLDAARHDESPLVREAAIAGLAAREHASRAVCDQLLEAGRDADTLVSMTALNELAACREFPDVIDALASISTTSPGVEREWHRPAAALISLAHASATRADQLLASFRPSAQPEMRAAVVRAAAVTGNDPVIRQFADDVDPAVAEAARRELGHAPVAIVAPPPPRPRTSPSEVVPEDLRRLAAARARIVVRGVGSLEMALLTSVAPRAVLRFARLAESGYFDGSSLGGASTSRVNLISADSTRADRLTGFRTEPSNWPLVRGVVGFAPTAAGLDGSILFINLVDDPACERSCTAFAHILAGGDILDRLLDGDVIEKVEIRPAF